MSEDGSQDGPDIEKAAAAAAEITSILDQIKAQKAEFDAAVTSASALISQEAQKTQAAASQLADLQSAVTSSKAAIEGDRAAIAEIVEKAKVSQKEIDGIKTDVATIKGAVDSVQQSVVGDQAVISQSKTDVGALKAAATALGEKLSADHASIADRIAGLQAQQDTLQNLLKDLSDAKAQAESDNTAIKSSLNDVDQSKERFSSLKSETETQFAALSERQQALEGKISEIEDANNRITALRKRLLESSDDAKSVQDEIDDLHSQITATLSDIAGERDAAIAALATLRDKADTDNEDFSVATNKRFDVLHKRLETMILALLPSAGAAGLASTYYDAKSRYAPTSYAGKPGGSQLTGWRRFLRSAVANNPASVVATLFFYALFLIPLGALAYGTYDLVWQIEHNANFHFDYRLLALRFLIAVPLATVSGFGFASLRLYRRLYEEYNHKQRVMELYKSFRTEIDAAGDKEHVKALLKIMLDAVSNKAWQSTSELDGKENEAIATLSKFTDIASKIKSLSG